MTWLSSWRAAWWSSVCSLPSASSASWWLRTKSERLNGFVTRMEQRALKKSDTVRRARFWGLFIFVAIPLPGTGAWTGTLAGSILDMKFKDVVKACMGGVLLAGIIMGLASAGLLGALSTLFLVG